MATPSLSEKQVAGHGCSQSSPIPNARSAFMPKPPRSRQRGALPRTFVEPASFPQPVGTASKQSLAQHISSQLNVPARPFSSPSSQQEASLKSPMEEQIQQPADASRCPMKAAQQGQLQTQHGMTSQRSMKKRKNEAPLQQERQLPHVGKFSMSWHRVSPQESSQQRGVVPYPQSQNSRPWQRGAILPPFQEQALRAPYIHMSSSQGSPFMQPTVAMEHTVCSPFSQMKFSFSEMWLQLEGAIQNRERMLLGMKAEMEKALSETKVSKVDALKEKEEVEARQAGVRDDTDMISKQTEKVKNAREGLEQISTDLSVQVAELNHCLQQAQEQQRVLKVLESLKDHRDASNDKNSFMFKNLHDCGVKLAAMEKELVGSKQTTELLEKSALKWTSDLENIEASCGSPNYAAKNGSSATSSMLQETAKIYSKTKMDARDSGFEGERETLAHPAALKQPKLEVVS